MTAGIYERAPLALRFWQKVRMGDGCWEWQGAKNPDGYGKIQTNGRLERSHRVSWELFWGPIPSGLGVLHRCDNPGCVRPDHLFLGTQADNNRDMYAKGRQSNRQGENHPRASLMDSDVLEIRRLLASGARKVDVARMYRVKPGVVYRIGIGRTWKHV